MCFTCVQLPLSSLCVYISLCAPLCPGRILVSCRYVLSSCVPVFHVSWAPLLFSCVSLPVFPFVLLVVLPVQTRFSLKLHFYLISASWVHLPNLPLTVRWSYISQFCFITGTISSAETVLFGGSHTESHPENQGLGITFSDSNTQMMFVELELWFIILVFFPYFPVPSAVEWCSRWIRAAEGHFLDWSQPSFLFCFGRKQFSSLWDHCRILFERWLHFWDAALSPHLHWNTAPTQGHSQQAVGPLLQHSESGEWESESSFLLLFRSSDSGQRWMYLQSDPSSWCQLIFYQRVLFHINMHNVIFNTVCRFILTGSSSGDIKVLLKLGHFFDKVWVKHAGDKFTVKNKSPTLTQWADISDYLSFICSLLW